MVARALQLYRFTQRVGPYLLIEAVMPGGTLLALLLYWYRRGTPVSSQGGKDAPALSIAVPVETLTVVPSGGFALAGRSATR